MEFQRSLAFIGATFIVIGILLTVFSQFGTMPRLPGDIYIKKDNFVFYFPIATSLVLSIAITLFVHFFRR